MKHPLYSHPEGRLSVTVEGRAVPLLLAVDGRAFCAWTVYGVGVTVKTTVGRRGRTAVVCPNWSRKEVVYWSTTYSCELSIEVIVTMSANLAVQMRTL